MSTSRRRSAVTFAALGTAAAVACGSEPRCPLGNSGVEECKTVAELDADERRQVCEWSTAEKGGEGAVYSCAGGVVLIVGSPDDCYPFRLVMQRPCSASVADLEACAHALHVSYTLCDTNGVSTPPVCDEIFDQPGCAAVVEDAADATNAAADAEIDAVGD